MLRALLVAALLVPAVGFAKGKKKSSYGYDVPVDEHSKKDGTYVPPHYRTKKNKTEYDNYSAEGNYNPYTGKKGSKKPRW
jgi:hypothetical protein